MAISTTTGTITSASGATGFVAQQSTGDSSAVVYVYGTYAGITVVFEGTLDETNWVQIPAYSVKTGRMIPSTGRVLNTNQAMGFYVGASPWIRMRIRATAYSSGTMNVNWQVGPGNAVACPIAILPQFNSTNVGLLTVQFATGNAGATPLVTTGPGILHNICVTTAGTVSTVFYDNASAASGTILYSSPASYALATKTVLNMYFANGITLNQVTNVAAGSINYQLL